MKHSSRICEGHRHLFDRIDVSIASGMHEDSQVDEGGKTNGLAFDRTGFGRGDGMLGCLSDLEDAQG
jgi:hypothetical protein